MVALKTVVIALGVLILGTFGVIAVALYNRAADGTAGTDLSEPYHATLVIGADCVVVESQMSQGRLLVRTDGAGACRRIHLIDLESGAVIGTIALSSTR